MLITFFCGLVIFCSFPLPAFLVFPLISSFLADIIVFGKLLCPQYNYAWNTKELSYHAASNDYYAAVRGNVYDLTKFFKIQCASLSLSCV